MRSLLCLSFLAALSTAAMANDTTVELGTGGIVPLNSAAIEMLTEDLFLSMDQIRVDYRFLNRTDQPVSATVAFPMPELVWDGETNVAVPGHDDNFLDFTVTMNGKPVAPELHQQALVDGVDVTAELIAAGVPLNPYAETVDAALGALPAAAANAWAARGLIRIDEYDGDGKGIRPHRRPAWAMRSAYTWQAEFPASAEATVSHSYTPSLGASAGLSFLWDGQLQEPRASEYRRRYCMDSGFEAALKRRADPGNEYRLAYVLGTGANWAGGRIGEFTLTVEKGLPDNLISFCGTGVERISPTRFRMRQRNFQPAGDLHVLIVGRHAHR